MTTRSWVGGTDNNNIYSAANWSSRGAPGSGDTLYMERGVATMNGGTLAGDLLTIGARTSSNLPYAATVNLSGGAVLSALVSQAAPTPQQVTFNVSGHAVLSLQQQSRYAVPTTITENIGSKSVLLGNFDAQGFHPSITVNGAADGTSRFVNVGTSSISDGVAVINADVLGIGSFTAGAFSGISFLGSVAAGQTVNSGGFDRITLGKPQAFQGLINYAGGPANTIDLLGVTADSYSYANDMLSLHRGGAVVDTLRLAADPNQFQVTEDARGVSVAGLPGGPPAGSHVLPRLP